MRHLPQADPAQAELAEDRVRTTAPLAAGAQDYPSRPIKLVVPFGPGTTTDTVARIYAEAMAKPLGQAIVVENKAGAGGNIAAEYTARSAPDGYTMFLAGDHHATNNHLNPNLTYDAVRDFEPSVNPNSHETHRRPPKRSAIRAEPNRGTISPEMRFVREARGAADARSVRAVRVA